MDAVTYLGKLYHSMAYELSILGVFFFSWAAWHFVSRARRWDASKKVADPSFRPSGGRSKNSRDSRSAKASSSEAALSAQRSAVQIMELVQDHYTRALRSYRELARRGEDVYVRDEAFYFALVQASIRVGHTDVVCELLRAARRHKVELSLQFFQSVLKLLASKQLFRECLVVQTLFGNLLPAERTICSCLTLAAAECSQPEVGLHAIKQLSLSGEQVYGRDYLNLFRYYAKVHEAQAAVNLINQLHADSIPFESIITNVVLSACVSAGKVNLAKGLFLKGVDSGGTMPVDVVSFNTLLKGYVLGHQLKECFDLLGSMSKWSITADEVTYSTLLDACIAENDFDGATTVIDTFIASGCTMNTVLYTTFMKGFVRMQMLDKAMELYSVMRQSQKGDTSVPSESAAPGSLEATAANSPLKADIILYSVLIKANCDQRLLEPALQLVQDMLEEGLQPDDIIVNRLLDGCRHLSNGELADKIFKDFVESANVTPTPPTIATMVKTYGKCGRVEDAFDLVSTMESRFHLQPSVVIYTCLMSACTRNKRLDLAFQVFDMMCTANVEPDGMTYSTLLKGCAQEHDWDRMLQLARRVAMRPGASVPAEVLNSVLSQMRSAPPQHAQEIRAVFNGIKGSNVSASYQNMRSRGGGSQHFGRQGHQQRYYDGEVLQR